VQRRGEVGRRVRRVRVSESGDVEQGAVSFAEAGAARLPGCAEPQRPTCRRA
jgi:hypothetical protein